MLFTLIIISHLKNINKQNHYFSALLLCQSSILSLVANTEGVFYAS